MPVITPAMVKPPPKVTYGQGPPAQRLLFKPPPPPPGPQETIYDDMGYDSSEEEHIPVPPEQVGAAFRDNFEDIERVRANVASPYALLGLGYHLYAWLQLIRPPGFNPIVLDWIESSGIPPASSGPSSNVQQEYRVGFTLQLRTWSFREQWRTCRGGFQ